MTLPRNVRRGLAGLSLTVAVGAAFQTGGEGIFAAATFLFFWLLLGEVMSWGGMAQAWGRLLGRDDVLIVDTETTGLGENAEVIEVAVIDTAGHVRLNALALPQAPGEIPAQALRVHGISRADLARGGARPWTEVHEELVGVLAPAKFVLAYNVAFDQRLLQQTAERHGLAIPKKRWRCIRNDYRMLMAGRQLHLAQAVEREGVRGIPGRAHRALHDCRRVLGVMEAFVLQERGKLHE